MADVSVARHLRGASEAGAANGSRDQAASDVQRVEAGPGTMQQLLKWRTRTKPGVSQRHISSVKKRMRQSLKRHQADSDNPTAAESSPDSTQYAGLDSEARQADSLDPRVASTLTQGKHTAATSAASNVAARVESGNAQTALRSESGRSLTVNGMRPSSSAGAYTGIGSAADRVTATEGSAAPSAVLRTLPEATSSSSANPAAADRRRVSGPIKAALCAQPTAALADWRRTAAPSPLDSRGWGQKHTSMRCPGMRRIIRRPPSCTVPHRMQQMPLAQLRMH